jgi:hypothetical protein
MKGEKDMYLVKTKNESIICNTAEEVKKYNKDEVINLFNLIEIDYNDVVSSGDIRDCIYSYLKGKQLYREEVVDVVSEKLGVKKNDVSKTITAMKKEKTIYVVEEFGWIGID